METTNGSSEPESLSELPFQTVEVLAMEEQMPPVDFSGERPTVVSREGKKEHVRMLQREDELYRKLYKLQHNIAPWERKDLLSLEYSKAEEWCSELELKNEQIKKERDAELQAKVDGMVAKAISDRTPVPPTVKEGETELRPQLSYVMGMEGLDSRLSAQKEQESAIAYVTAMAGAKVRVDAAEEQIGELRAEVNNLKADKTELQAKVASAQKQVVDSPRPVKAEVVIDEKKRPTFRESLSGLGTFAALVFVACLAVFAAIFVAVRFGPEAWNQMGAVAETISSQSKETAAQISHRRSTPTREELDRNPSIVRTRELIERNRKLAEPEKGE